MTGGQGADYAYEDGPEMPTWREVFGALVPATVRAGLARVVGKSGSK